MGGERGIIELIDFILGKMFILTADTGALREFGKLFSPSKPTLALVLLGSCAVQVWEDLYF